MKHSALTIFSVTSSIKYLGRLLLSLLFCTLLIGCDNQSAAVSSSDEASDTMSQSRINTGVYKEDASESSASMDDAESANAGESLIAAATPNDPSSSSRTRRAPMISEGNTDGALQATLIGDYVGILPCDFCTDILVTLNLFSDGSVLKTSVYQNSEKPKLPLIEPGIYRQDNAIITVVYDNKDIESYSIQDNHLVMMNENKSLNADYTLSRK